MFSNDWHRFCAVLICITMHECACACVCAWLCSVGNSITLKLRFKKGTNPIGVFGSEAFMLLIMAAAVGVASTHSP